MIQLNDKLTGYVNNQLDTTPKTGGLQMSFSNGNTISIQFGFGNYCDNKNLTKDFSKDAEIAIWNDSGEWYNFGNDTVKGYCNTDEIAKWIHFAANNNI